MTVISEMKDLFADWIASVARAVDAVAGRYVQPQLIAIEESADGSPDEIARAILMKMDEYSRGQQTDDATVVVVRAI